MKIHTNSRDRLIACLDKRDMERYKIDFNTLDINDSNTSRLIADLLEIAGIKPRDGACRMNIDAVFPNSDELLVILSVNCSASRRKGKLRVSGRRFFCVLSSGESLFALCDALLVYRDIILDSRLYSCSDGYAVEISQNALDKINLRHVLSEFGSVHSCSTRLRRAYIGEHCTLICDGFIRKLSS